MYFAEGMVLVTGAVISLVTFIHRLYFTIHGKMKRKTYRRAKWGISFLVSGMIAFYLCFHGGNLWSESTTSGMEALRIVFYLSGVWMLIGIGNIIAYYYSITKENREVNS